MDHLEEDRPSPSSFSWSWRDHQVLDAAFISSWKLINACSDGGGPFACFCISVTMRNGLKWTIEKRYSQFRILRKTLKDSQSVSEDLLDHFPPKIWLWNLSTATLQYRKERLTSFLQTLVKLDPQPTELLLFLQVANNVSLSLSRHSTDAGSSNGHALRFRALRSSSCNRLASTSFSELTSVHDFKIMRVIGKGSFGKVYLVRPSVGGAAGEFYAMKVLRKTEVVKRHQGTPTHTHTHTHTHNPTPTLIPTPTPSS